MKKHLTAALGGVLLFSACNSDVVSPEGDITSEERAELLSLVAEIPFFEDEFGEDGVPTSSASAAFEGAAAVGPQNWGRRRGRPVNSETYRIEIDRENGLATLIKELEFDGEFLVLDQASDQIVRKDLREVRTQTATFRLLDNARADEQTGNLHRWQLVAISPAEFRATEPENRLVIIDTVRALVNGEVVMEITDPSALIRIEDRIARLDRDTEISIQAVVSNQTTDEFDPEATFVYLHLRHAAVGLRVWRRMPMEYDPEVAAYVATWVVRHRGRERIVVDALDAETVSVSVEDPYLSNIWVVPYRTRILTDAAVD
jgi:hypothetical protein